jgi:tetratricopeptide (TPR) repeat protein
VVESTQLIALRRFVLLGMMLAASILVPPVVATRAVAAPSESGVQRRQGREIKTLGEDLEKSEKNFERIFLPVSFLIGILALGGGLGVVFSIRDQRRISQLHELSVGGEMMSQRRAEQSYASFFEQSQTTLSLVNDTLELSKEANLRASESMKQRAEEQLNAISERADDLLQRVYREGDFEKIVYKPELRVELHAIADELRSVEGFLRLQDIDPPPRVKFLKAIGQFLDDDTEGALRILRQISQAEGTGELRRFTLFWLGYLSTTVGEYREAVQTFLDDDDGLAEDDTEHFQLKCIIDETRFFEKAKRLREGKGSDDDKKAVDRPLKRLLEVAEQLDDLADLAYKVAKSKDTRERHHVSLEVARTRADIYIWIAHEPSDLNKQLGPPAVAEIGKKWDLSGPPADVIRGDEEQLDEEQEITMSDVEEQGAAGFAQSEDARNLSDDGLRAWALRQGAAICEAQHDPNFDVVFALAECHFKLGNDEEAEAAINEAEDLLSKEFGDYMEQRKKATLRQSDLICRRWLFHLEKKNDAAGSRESRRRVAQAAEQTRDAAAGMHQGRVTIFSQVQRRNIPRPEFVKEVEAIARLPEEVKENAGKADGAAGDAPNGTS